MKTGQATNLATHEVKNPLFRIDFDKKKLTAQALRCAAEHQRVQSWMNNPLIQQNFEKIIHEKVIISKKSMDMIVAFDHWQKTLPKPGLSPLYQTILLSFYLKDMGLMSQQLRTQGFEMIAEDLVRFLENENNQENCSQQTWFELFFEAWQSALNSIEKKIQAFCFESCFQAQAITLLDNQQINDRQYELLIHLQKEIKIRDKKSLSYSLWFRGLYRGLTKRTQERDFNLICELGFVQMKGKSEFVVMG